MAVSGEMIKQTQSSLGQFVKKPPLTDKLLTKPPFRFLHDVISAIITDTGSLEGLYDEREMKSDNVKDKEAKVEYLTKLIDCISFTTGENLSVKPGKIVSGQEADKTNEMLQVLANIVINKVDTSEAVSRVRNGEKPGKANKAKKEEGKKSREKSKSPVKTPSKKESSPKSGKENRENNKENERNKNQNNRGRREPTRSPGKNSKKDILEENENNNDLHTNGFVASSETDILRNDQRQEVKPVRGDAEESRNAEDDFSGNERPRTSRPVTSKERRKKTKSPETNGVLSKQNSFEGSEEPQLFGSGQAEAVEETVEMAARPTTSQARAGSARPKTGRLKSARPPSARPAAPAIKKKREITVEEQPRPATAKVSNLILDNDDDDDGEEFLIEEAPKDPLSSLEPDLKADNEAIEAGGQEHGALVQQILETQKELQDGNKVATSPRRGVEIVRLGFINCLIIMFHHDYQEREKGIGESTRAKDREATLREVNKLKSSIQTLTKSAHPLGKLMDFLQEDVDSMQVGLSLATSTGCSIFPLIRES